jgi:hypothetical protein
MGRQLALSDDECACLCSPRPRLIASQDRHAHLCAQVPGDGEQATGSTRGQAAASGLPASGSPLHVTAAAPAVDRSFHLLLQTCDAGGRPHADLRYRKCSAAVPDTRGETAATGATRPLIQTASGRARAAFGMPSIEVKPWA